MTEQFKNIARYLNNEMSEAERESFEEQLQKDESLAEELEVLRGLQGFLHREAPELESKLAQLGDEFNNKKKRSFPLGIIGIFVSLLLILGVVYFFNISSSPEKEPTIITPNSATDTIKSIDSSSLKKKEVIENTPLPEALPEVKTIETKPTLQPSQPIAALNKEDFKPNPILENLMRKNVRNNTSDEIMTMIEPLPDAIFSNQSIVNLIVRGTTNIPPNYQLLVYSNSGFNIENDHSILSTNLKSTQKDDMYYFRFNGEIPLKKGLYYLLIRKDDDMKLLHISRFTVK